MVSDRGLTDRASAAGRGGPAMYANHFGGWLPRTDSSTRLLDYTRCTNPKSMVPKVIEIVAARQVTWRMVGEPPG